MTARNYLVVNAYGRSNRGDSVLLDQCLEQIRLADPAARIAGVVFEGVAGARAVHPDVDWTERIGNATRLRGIAARLESVFYLAVAWIALHPRFGWLAALLPRGQQATLAAYRRADIVVSAPGGYIHDTNLAYLIALLHIRLGTLAGKPTILAPQSLGPLSSDLAVRLTRRVLARCVAVCVRESYSLRFVLDRLGLPPAIVRVAGDSAFWDMNVTQDSRAIDANLERIGLAAGEPFVGASVVDWTFPGNPDPAAARDRYLSAFAETARRIHATSGLRTVIFNQVTEDLVAVREVARRAGPCVLHDATSVEPPLLRGMIGRSRLFLGTRFHSCIFAMMAGRPVTAIAYLPKTTFIMADLGLDDIVDIAAVSADELTAILLRQLEDPEAAAARVIGAVEHYRETQVQFYEVLQEVTAARVRQAAVA